MVAGGFVFLSGQVALLPDGTFAGGSVEQQTVRAGDRATRDGYAAALTAFSPAAFDCLLGTERRSDK